jgi:hypothetical protein
MSLPIIDLSKITPPLKSPKNDIFKFTLIMSFILLIVGPIAILELTEDFWLRILLILLIVGIGVFMFLYSFKCFLNREEKKEEREYNIRMKEIERGMRRDE